MLRHLPPRHLINLQHLEILPQRRKLAQQPLLYHRYIVLRCQGVLGTRQATSQPLRDRKGYLHLRRTVERQDGEEATRAQKEQTGVRLWEVKSGMLVEEQRLEKNDTSRWVL